MKFKIIILLLLITSFANRAFSVSDVASGSSSSSADFTKSGAAGSQFLKIPVGARATGMGGAYGSVADDVTAMFWNPAGLTFVKNMEAVFSYTQWFAGMSSNYGAMAFPIGKDFRGGVFFTNFTTGDILKTSIADPNGTGTTYSVSDLAFGATFSGYLTKEFTFGVTAKMIRNAFSTLSSTGIAFDVGTTYITGVEGIKIGFSIHNLGSQMQYEGNDLNTTKRIYDAANIAKVDVTMLSYPYNLPMSFRASVSGDIIKDETSKLIACGDFVTLSDASNVFAVGVEYAWTDLVYVRGGYATGQYQVGLSGGLGLKYNTNGFDSHLDYSIQPSKDFGVINRFTVQVGF